MASIAVGLAGLGACGGGDPIAIGVLSDCRGAFGAFYETTLAGAELALIDRGAQLKGPGPADGVTRGSVAGKEINLHLACADGTAASSVAVARRLVEDVGVDVLVGPLSGSEALGLRDYARQQPRVVFVLGSAAHQSPTFRATVPNVLRFATDGVQWQAGLGSYAYEELGWRTAAVVGEDYSFPWLEAAGFVAEFCSLGGEVLDRVWLGADDRAGTLAGLPEEGIDGVFFASVGADVLPMLAESHPLLQQGLAETVLGDLITFSDPSVLGLLGDQLDGIVYSGTGVPLGSSGQVWDGYVAQFAAVFPDIPPALAASVFVVAYRNAMEAVLAALEEVGGDLANGKQALMAALASQELDAPNGKIRLDQNRQAIGPNYLYGLVSDGQGAVVPTDFRTIANVDQSLGGLFSPEDPPVGRDEPECKRGNPPPWASAGASD